MTGTILENLKNYFQKFNNIKSRSIRRLICNTFGIRFDGTAGEELQEVLVEFAKVHLSLFSLTSFGPKKRHIYREIRRMTLRCLVISSTNLLCEEKSVTVFLPSAESGIGDDNDTRLLNVSPKITQLVKELQVQ